MGAWDAPEGEYKTRPYTGLIMTVQQNAAGVWGVPDLQAISS